MNFEIKKIGARLISDSNSRPTVEAKVKTDFGVFEASVPSGISTGRLEAVVLEPQEALKNILEIIAPALEGRKFSGQREIDDFLIRLDGTKNKSRLGANAVLPLSVAFCRAAAASQRLPLYQYLRKIYIGDTYADYADFPRPSFNMIEGGRHSDSGLAFQEFMAVPQKKTFRENFTLGRKIYKNLKAILQKKFKKVKLSKEGAFSCPIKTAFEAIDFILEAAKGEDVKIAIDAAGARGEDYRQLIEKFPILSIEDPFGENEFERFAELKKETGGRLLIFGDDLTVSSADRIRLAWEKNACNGLILKPNQIGTIKEALESAKLAKSFGWKIMVSNRASETKDDFIADLAVGVGAEFIKSGAPFPKERLAKYNRLLEIEKETRPKKSYSQHSDINS